MLLCFVLAMRSQRAAAWQVVRGQVFAPAPQRRRGGVRARRVRTVGRAARRGAGLRRRLDGRDAAPRDPRGPRTPQAAARRTAGARPAAARRGARAGDRLVVLEGERPDAWWLPGAAPQLVITTAALRRLKGRQLDAVLAHEQGHARARHDWLLHCSSALASGFPRVPVFAAFRDEMHRLVELAADDVASTPLRPADHRPGPGRTQRGPRGVRALPHAARPGPAPRPPVADAAAAAHHGRRLRLTARRRWSRGSAAGGIRAGTLRTSIALGVRPG